MLETAIAILVAVMALAVLIYIAWLLVVLRQARKTMKRLHNELWGTSLERAGTEDIFNRHWGDR